MSEEFINTIENFIKDKSKEAKPYWYSEGKFPVFNTYTMNTLDKIIWSKVGSFEYYGIPFQSYGEKTTAFYKSKDKLIYHIEMVNDTPISYYKIFSF